MGQIPLLFAPSAQWDLLGIEIYIQLCIFLLLFQREPRHNIVPGTQAKLTPGTAWLV